MEAIAKRKLIGKKPDGSQFEISIEIGRPYQFDEISWACPVSLHGIDSKYPDMRGIDSLQSLMIAINLVRNRLTHFVEGGGKLFYLEDPTSECLVQEIFQ